MTKKFLSFALIAFSVFGFTSCLNSGDDSEAKGYVSGYYTIAGDVNSGYTFYQDGGGIVKPTAASVSNATNGKGFQGKERAVMVLTYGESGVENVEGGQIIKNADINSGQFITVVSPMTKDQADVMKITDADSIFDVKSIKNAWIYRGFLTTIIDANFSYKNSTAINPTCTLVYDDDEKEVDGKLTLNILYNRHTEKNKGYDYSGEIGQSYPMEKLQSLLTGTSDSLEVTIKMQGAKDATFKVAREDFRKGNYVPFKSKVKL